MFYLSPTFWVAVSFVIFVALAYRPVARLLAAALDKRAAGVKEELDEALRLKEEARALLASYQRKQREAAQEAENILTHAQEEARRIKDLCEESLEESLNHRVELSMQKIALYESAVLEDIRRQSVEIAVSAVRSLVKESMTKSASDALIDKAITNINKKLH